jgi:hypothetical protein
MALADGYWLSCRQLQFVRLYADRSKEDTGWQKLRCTRDFRRSRGKAMKIYWNDNGRGPDSKDAQEVTLNEARQIWDDEIRGMKGNFFGLIDDQDRTIQFYLDEEIPDRVEDARHLRIVLMDFPVPAQRGSYVRRVTIGEVLGLIEKAFYVGANYREFGDVYFQAW